MNREDLREIIERIVDNIEKQSAETACIFWDCDQCSDCDVVLKYGILPD